MSFYVLPILRGLLLIAAIALISYVVSTPGDQPWQSFTGGIAGMWSVTLQSFEKRR